MAGAQHRWRTEPSKEGLPRASPVSGPTLPLLSPGVARGLGPAGK